MPLTEKQLEYLKHCNHRWNVKTGATGSGKSFLDFTVTIPKRIQACRGEGLIVLLGNTRGTLERNILEPMRQWWPGNVGMIRSDNTVELFGKKVYALGADNKKHVARIQGATFEYVYGDEVTTWSEDVFQMLKSRLRCEHSHFDGTCNPDNPRHWFKTFLDSDADIYQQSYVIDDGVLPARVVSELKKEYAGTVFYDRYILGLWRRADGLVYPNFSEERHITDIMPFLYDDGRVKLGAEFYVSCDYGIVNPFSAHLWALYNGIAYCWKEYYFDSKEKRRQKTDEEHYEALDAMIGDIPVECIVVDPSATSFKETIRRHDKHSVANAVNDVINGISTVASLLNADRIIFNSECKNAIREFGMYSWDSEAQEDAVIKEFDHAMDDIRYMCHTIVRREFDWLDWSVRGGKNGV